MKDKERVKFEVANFFHDSQPHSNREVLEKPASEVFDVVHIILQSHLAQRR